MKLQTEFIPLNDGSHICAPSNITLMTPYVLREQGDWFEDEIRFVRSWIKPNMAAIDIGANYGLYSHAIAKKLGPKGKLWCFEPTPNTAEALRATIKQNKYRARVKVVESGLSDQAGQATFYMSPNAELNSLEPVDGAFVQKQTIELTTLDDFALQHKLPEIDFIKLDAEGEELKILHGGKAFFKQHSPLVMFELMHVDRINHQLLAAFESIDFALYYLIPGLNTLAPFALDRGYDRFLLNLFAVPRSSLAKFAQEGVIISDAVEAFVEMSDQGLTGCKALVGGSLGIPGRDVLAGKVSRLVAVALDKKQDKQTRFCYLNEAAQLLNNDDMSKAGPELLATAARVFFMLGKRELGLRVLEYFLNQYPAKGALPEVGHSYMAPHSAHDGRAEAGNAAMHLCALMVDAYIRMAHRSGYFAGTSLQPHFNVLKQLGAMTPELERREKIALARSAAMRAG